MRKSLWSPDEDEKLRRYVATHGCGNWSDVAKHTGLHRCGKSCRLRWINYLRPDLKRGPFSAHEVRLVVNLHNTMGNSWSKIATQLPGRTDNDVKNFWHSYTRSRRIQQQQQSTKSNHNNGVSMKGNDRKAGSSHEQYENGEMHRTSINEQGYIINKSNNNYEDLMQLQPVSQASNIKGLAAHCKNVNSHLSACKPSDPYATGNALSHTHMNRISFDQPNHVAAQNNQPGSHVLFTQEANITLHPLINLDSKPINNMQPHSSTEDSQISAFYKGFPPHIFNDQCCSKAPSISFQHFPPLKEASDHSNIINALPSSHVYGMDSVVKLKTALYSSNPSRINPLIPHEKPHSPHAFLGDYPAASFDSSGQSLPASYGAIKDESAEIKPPEGLQSVIWSFLKGQPEASTSADASDDYDKARYVAFNQQHYYHDHVIKPQSEVSNYFLSDHHHPHQQLPSDHQCTNAEAFSYTSPSNLPCLQAQYLADCFS